MRAALALAVLTACGGAATPPPRSPAPDARPLERPTDADAELEARVRSVVVAQRARFRLCYEQGLLRDAALAGRVLLVVEVDQTGHAAHVLEARREGSFTDAELKCFARVLKATQFHDGAGRPIRIQLPLAFAPSAP